MLNINGRIDERAATEGVWHDITFRDAGDIVHIRLKLALADLSSNKQFFAHMQKLTQPHQRAIELGVFDGAMDLHRRAFAEVIVKDWEGIGDGNGNPAPYDAALCQELFKNYPEVFSQVQELAKDASNYRTTQREAAEGNSEPASEGN